MKKILSIIIIIVLNVNVFCSEIENGKNYTVKDTKEVLSYFTYKGVEQKIPKFVYILDNNEEKLAYCLDLKLIGPDKIEGNSYDLKVEGLLGNGSGRLPTTSTNEKEIANCITSGYPYVNMESLGVKNENEGYIATQFAIWTIQGKVDKEYLNPKTGFSHVYNAYLKILEDTKNKKYEGINDISINILDKKAIEDSEIKEYVSQRFIVNSSNPVKKVEITNIDKDIKITTEKGELVESIKCGITYKACIKKSNINELKNNKISFNVSYKDDIVYFGVAPLEGYQNMGLCTVPDKEFKIEFEMDIDKVNIPLEIIKLDSKTGEKLEGAVFEIIDELGNVIEKITSNKSGIAKCVLSKEGIYTVKEIVAPSGYFISNDKKIDAKYKENITLEFSNDKVSNIKITKIDGETSEKIKGVEFVLISESGEKINKVTNKDGYIEYTNLTSGVYKLQEISAPIEYEINKKEVEIKLDIGETKNIEIVNYKIKEEIKENRMLPKTGY